MGPLEGIKVLDLTAMVSGPVATMMLADQGAEVIKVEPPGGEQMRHMGMPHNGVPATFYSCNRGKKSIVIDLKADAGKRVLTDLVRDADVLVQNFRPGAIARMGFGEDVVRKLTQQSYMSRSAALVKTDPMPTKGYTTLSFKRCRARRIFRRIVKPVSRRCFESSLPIRSHR